ncbi:hypothetical protein FHW20_004465 [Ochrobactrum intermedium]|uniref:Uncharacterized protein n=1 Tax=Brucella intermedia TaxID=94625 RepID=A0ABR6AVH9_9HYPH|nr:hypothetical protein [Brucella intermedia]
MLSSIDIFPVANDADRNSKENGLADVPGRRTVMRIQQADSVTVTNLGGALHAQGCRSL